MSEVPDGQRVQALLEQGASLYEAGKLYEALASWKEALVLDPHNEIATEYLRFIEENFGIGVDAFLAHRDVGASDEPPHPPPPKKSPEDSIEEMDWSEILEDGEQSEKPPAAGLDTSLADEEFFVELGDDSLQVAPGGEAAAWGAANSPAAPPPPAAESQDGPTTDPFSMPLQRFAETISKPVEAGPFVDTGTPVPDTWASEAFDPDGRDLSEMSEESIEMMLENDFKSWEEATGGALVPPSDPFAVEEEAESAPSDRPPARLPGPSASLESEWDGMPPPLAPSWPPDEMPAPRGTAPLVSGLAKHFAADGTIEDSIPVPIPDFDDFEESQESTRNAKRTADIAAGAFSALEDSAFDPAPVVPPNIPLPLGLESAPPRSDQPDFLPDLDLLGSMAAEFEALDTGEIGPDPFAAALGGRAEPTRPGLPSTQASGEQPVELLSSMDAGVPLEAAPQLSARRTPLRSSAPPARAPTPAPPPASSNAVEDELAALLRSGLDEIEAIEARSVDGIRQLLPPPPSPETDLDGLMVDARRRQQAGDFSGSLELVEKVLAADPEHREARTYLQQNTSRLLGMYRSRLGPLSRMPKVKLRPEEIIWQSLDHRAGFLLSQVDGRTTFEDIIEIAGMAELEATRILARLVEFGVIG